MTNNGQERVLTGYHDVRSALKHPDLVQALYDEGAQVMGDALITLPGPVQAGGVIVQMQAHLLITRSPFEPLFPGETL